jgi:hypothetical protein
MVECGRAVLQILAAKACIGVVLGELAANDQNDAHSFPQCVAPAKER